MLCDACCCCGVPCCCCCFGALCCSCARSDLKLVAADVLPTVLTSASLSAVAFLFFLFFFLFFFLLPLFDEALSPAAESAFSNRQTKNPPVCCALDALMHAAAMEYLFAPLLLLLLLLLSTSLGAASSSSLFSVAWALCPRCGQSGRHAATLHSLASRSTVHA